MLIGSVLVVLVVAQLVRVAVRVWSGDASLAMDRLLLPREVLAKRIGMVALTALFVASMDWLGLTLALFLATAVALVLMGVRRRSHLFWTPFGVSAVAYVLFIAILDSQFPHGPVEMLLARLF